VKTAWQEGNHHGSHAFRITQKIKAVRDNFKRWNKQSFGIIEKDINQKKEELRLVQENIHTLTDVLQERLIRDQLEELLHREEIMWSQKAKKHWDLNGDRNTKFFQAVVKNRRRRNRILQIKKDDTTWITNIDDIQQCFVDHYNQLFSEPQNHSTEHIHNQIRSLPGPTLSDNQIALLD
jgi:hypothetical protein